VKKKLTIGFFVVAAIAAVLVFNGLAQKAPKGGQSGTTLAAYKTLDICEVSPATDTTPAIWRYSGEISVWNQGAVDTVGFDIQDVIQTKVAGSQYYDIYGVSITPSPANFVIPAGTTMETATVFKYSFEGPALDPLYIRNVANLTILNHSGNLGTPYGPSPKVTWTGGQPLPCPVSGGCTYTQGYWGSKPGVVWPATYSRDAAFFLSGQTWQQVMDTPVNVSQGYYQLAHQYIAAILNKANGAMVPEGVQTTLGLAEDWLTINAPSACPTGGSCGTQKTWAGILDDYNKGDYVGGPGHCGDE
jgi:hypothetical protein